MRIMPVIALLAALVPGLANAQQRNPRAGASDSTWVPRDYSFEGAAGTSLAPSAAGATKQPDVPVTEPPRAKEGRWKQIGNANSMHCVVTGETLQGGASSTGYVGTANCQFTFECVGGECATPDPSGWRSASSCVSWGHPDPYNNSPCAEAGKR